MTTTSSIPAMANSFEKTFVKARVKLLNSAPFFGVLLLNSKYILTEDVPTAATDGERLLFNEQYMNNLSFSSFVSAVLHEVLHLALEHLERMKSEFKHDPVTANVAADIVVNGIIKDNGFSVEKNWISDDQLKGLSIREIYNILKQKQREDKDYLKNKYGVGEDEVNICVRPDLSDGEQSNEESQEGGGATVGRKVKTNWKDVLNKASTIARTKSYGLHGAGLNRIFKEFLEPTINWRDALYKYITSTRNDFEGFDRRSVHNGQYLDDVGGSKIQVLVFMDTSASVDEKLLGEFIAELRFAIQSLPQISGEMWYFDTDLYPLGDIMEVMGTPKVSGGGGTMFSPALEMMKVRAEEDMTTQVVGIIFTDGYAQLKNLPQPDCSVVWCISPGGADSELMPFGEVLRIMR